MATVGLLVAGCTMFTDPDEFAASESGAEAVCDQYCDAVMDNCFDANAVFADWDSCAVFCEDLRPGTEGDTTGDSAHCRLYHATVAAQASPELHCTHASPEGGGECVDAGTNGECEEYCGLLADKCQQAFQEIPGGDIAQKVAECVHLCQGLQVGQGGALRGDTWQCRVTWADEIIYADAEVPLPFCPSALPLPQRKACNDGPNAPCEALCMAYGAYCGVDGGEWGGEPGCRQVCDQVRISFPPESVECAAAMVVEDGVCTGLLESCAGP